MKSRRAPLAGDIYASLAALVAAPSAVSTAAAVDRYGKAAAADAEDRKWAFFLWGDVLVDWGAHSVLEQLEKERMSSWIRKIAII